MLDRCVLSDTMGGHIVRLSQHVFPLLMTIGQEPVLFACSIRDNIKYGNPCATMDQVEAAAKLANAHDFIMSFSDGYDTQVGDKGSFEPKLVPC
jgi:ABC-type multidrug transport system fused ATPase/permease subunit